MEYKIVSENIDAQEHLDAYITASLLEEKIGEQVSNLVFTEMPKGCHYDLAVNFNYKDKDYKWAFEIKERNKTDWQLENYPTSELKEQKKNWIMDSTKGYDRVYYIQLINKDFAYCYNMHMIDWDKIEKHPWKIKQTQFNPDSGYEEPEVYFIPYKLGRKFTGLNKYYTNYTKI